MSIIVPGQPQKVSVDISALMRVVLHLDECLKRGLVVGVFEDSLEVSDEDIVKALQSVRSEIGFTITAMEKLARTITRQGPESARLQ